MGAATCFETREDEAEEPPPLAYYHVALGALPLQPPAPTFLLFRLVHLSYASILDRLNFKNFSGRAPESQGIKSYKIGNTIL